MHSDKLFLVDHQFTISCEAEEAMNMVISADYTQPITVNPGVCLDMKFQ